MLKVFSVHDAKATAYNNPFFMRTTGEAIRAFSSHCQDESHDFNKFAPDFTLVEIGNFDPNTGAIVSHEKPIILSNASEYKH